MFKKFIWYLDILFLLIGCAHSQPIPLSATKVIEKPVVIRPPTLQMQYQLNYANNPALQKAYQQYVTTGKAPNVITDGFEQFAYNMNAQPIVAAGIFELTVISLEAGENVTNVSSGDPMRWSYSLAYSGQGKDRQAHVMVKPSQENISTDLVITTDKRMYTLKLVAATNGKYIKDVRFWYPQEIQTYWENYNTEQSKKFSEDINPKIIESSNINLDQLNFAYRLTHTGWSKPSWMPIRAFDDGTHTYLQFAATIKNQDMPALFILNANQQELVNYRVKSNYFIIDKIFNKAVLLMGVGSSQIRVTIINSLKI